MDKHINPFEYESAKKLPKDMFLDVYIEDYNYIRFIKSHRNIFLLGDRGSGKSMTLLYNSFEYCKLKAEKDGTRPSLDYIGIYIPCNTPLIHKEEQRLLNEFKETIISEHFLVTQILSYAAEVLLEVSGLLNNVDDSALRTQYEYVLGEKLPRDCSFFEAVRLFAQSQSTKAQKEMNKIDSNAFYENTLSFASAILPLLNLAKRIPGLENSHFLLMIDDAHDLNKSQKLALNSWIAYRDHSLYSFKIATAKVESLNYHTFSGGSILEGHDFITIDMEWDLQNKFSHFGKMAKQLIQKRLARININKSPEEFFPVNEQMSNDLEECKNKIIKEANEKFSNGSNKQVSDYVYKFARAEYFRQRHHKANRPPYSGFNMLMHLSTGVIRNLLLPCYWMYDDVISKKQSNVEIQAIPPSIQAEVIIRLSEEKWEFLENDLEKTITHCSKEEARQVYNIFNNLAILFRERLLHHSSEPRAIVFTISGMTEEYEKKLRPLLNIARKTQLLYIRRGVAKSDAMQETYYVPNRILWPSRGLDPEGQHARVSLKASDILNAADGKKFPFAKNDETIPMQESFF